MATQQPIWKLVGTVGDVNPFDYSGGFVYVDTTGVYRPELEWIEVELDEETYSDYGISNNKWSVYRFSLDRCTLANIPGRQEKHLIPFGFDTRTDLPYPLERYVEWFDADLDSICRSHGTKSEEFKACLCSDNPMELAYAYLAMAQYHGFENFDDYPLKFDNQEEIEQHYERMNSERA